MSGATGAGRGAVPESGRRQPWPRRGRRTRSLSRDDQAHRSPQADPAATDTRGPQPAAARGRADRGRSGQPGRSRPAAQPPQATRRRRGVAAAGRQPAAAGVHPPQAGAARRGGACAGRAPGARTTPRTRKARLRVAKADPWSVMKVSFLLSIALGICTIVAAAVLWMVMDAMGVFSTVGGTISEATGSNEGNGFDLQSFLSLPRVLMFTSIIAVIDVVLATALATLGAFIYNLSAGFVGGVELTLAEDE